MKSDEIIILDKKYIYPIRDRVLWSRLFDEALLTPCGIDEYGYLNHTSEKKIDNNIFTINPYYWGDCTCEEEYGHKEDCPCIKPNFLYKPTGFAIIWYKYPFRDSKMNKNISINQFVSILNHCRLSWAKSELEALSNGNEE